MFSRLKSKKSKALEHFDKKNEKINPNKYSN